MTVSINAADLLPYRVEWRPDLTCGWVLIKSYPDRDEAAEGLDGAVRKWQGQARIVTQHVIAAAGMCSDVFAPRTEGTETR